MTGKQIEQRENAIYYRVYKGGPRIGKWDLFTPEENEELKELSVRDMINSVLIYGYRPKCTEVWDYEEGKKVSIAAHILKYNRYVSKYAYDKNDFDYIGEERTIKLINEQVEDFAKAEVGFAGYDSEGCSYRYCNWGDE